MLLTPRPSHTQDGAFDEAVKGVDAIAHTASPFHFKADDPSELIVPAVRGTTGILASALAHAPQAVNRIVITSSCAAVLTPARQPGLFSEEDWNEASIAAVESQGRAAPNAEKYRASKTFKGTVGQEGSPQRHGGHGEQRERRQGELTPGRGPPSRLRLRVRLGAPRVSVVNLLRTRTVV